MSSMSTNEYREELMEAGLSKRAADLLARNSRRVEGPSPLSMLATVTSIGFVFLIAGMGWVLLDVNQLDQRVETVNRDITELKVQNAELKVQNAEMQADIDILKEQNERILDRLPPRS